MMMGGLGMGLGMLFVIGLPLLVLFGSGAILAYYLKNKPTPQPAGQRSPQHILETRLASGEINLEEYESIRKQLENAR